jgi:large subunit ribosomal protein L20
MTRVKRGVNANKRRNNLLKYTKGFRWGRKAKEALAKEALLHAWTHAFQGRKEKKRNFRRLWNVKIGAAGKSLGIGYSKLIPAFKKANIKLDRKILADLAQNEPKVFEQLVAKVK